MLLDANHTALMQWTEAHGELVCRSWGGYQGTTLQYEQRLAYFRCNSGHEVVLRIPGRYHAPDLRPLSER